MVKVTIKPKSDFLLKGSDLSRIQEHLKVEPIKLSGFKLEFETNGPINKAVEARIQKELEDQLAGLEKDVLESFEMCIAVLEANPSKADEFAAKYTTLIQSVLKTADTNIRADIKALLLDLKQKNQLKLESDVAIVLKFVFTGIKIVKSVTLIAASHGVKLDEWVSLAKSVYDLGVQVYEALKTEATRLKELVSAVKALEAAKGPARKEAKKKAEEARKKYREQVTKSNQLLDQLGKKAGELQTKMKQATNLKEGVAVGAKLMVLKRQIGEGLTEQLSKEKRLEAIAKSLEALGVEVNDATWLQRIKAFDVDTLKETLSTGKEIVEAAKEVKEIVETIASLVH